MSVTGPIAREHIVFRAATADDSPFLVQLYASTRAAEMAQVPWDDHQKFAFLLQQFNAQKRYYETSYPDCRFLVIEIAGALAGRLYIDREADNIHVIDISLVASLRGRGVGRMLLEEVVDEARSNGKSVGIYVEHLNPARRLYDRLGFRQIETVGLYHRMEWRSSVS